MTKKQKSFWSECLKNRLKNIFIVSFNTTVRQVDQNHSAKNDWNVSAKKRQCAAKMVYGSEGYA